MKHRPLAFALLVLSVLGIADSWYLTQSALMSTPLTCNINGLSGCNIVEQSQYSHLFGIPLGIYGLVFYGILLLLGIYIYLRHSRLVFLGLLAISWIGLLASAVFVYIQAFMIRALCIYCLSSALISLLLAVSATWLWRKYRLQNLAIPEPIPAPPAS